MAHHRLPGISSTLFSTNEEAGVYGQANQGTALTLPAECVASFGGIFAFILLVALPLAILLTWLTVRLYRNNISRVMRQHSGSQPEAANKAPETAPDTPPGQPLSISIIKEDAAIPRSKATIAAEKRLTQTAAAYALAGLAQAIIISALTFALSNTQFLPVRFASTVFLYLWPVVPSLILTSVSDPRVKWIGIGGYFGLLLTLEWVLVGTGTMQGSAPGSLIIVWLTWMGPPSLLLWILSNRAWRSVGLLAYLVAVALTTGWLAATQGLACLSLALNDVTLWANYRWPVLVGTLVATAGLAALTLRSIANRYRRKQLSDQSLTLDSWWFVITLVEVVIQFDATQGASISFFLGFLVYRYISRRLLPTPGSSPISSLLLLRVFGYRYRSRKLLDQLSQRWRFLGPINLIGAPDVAATNLEPDELIQFWAGHGQDLFIAAPENLQARLGGIDHAPDPDGRYRVNEFFCYDDTWRETVKALAISSDAILMDLRSFGPKNHGCEYELGLLLADVPLNKTMLLVDNSTDRAVLEALLHRLWREIPLTSPNRNQQEPTLRLFEAAGPVHSIKPLMSILAGETR